MKITLKTTLLQDMVSRAAKGAGNNKLIPLTNLLGIKLEDSVLTLTTTDATNYLYIIQDKIVGEHFSVTVPVDVFCKLISRMTCEDIILDIDKELGSVKLKGNGNYKIELPLDENGLPIVYPNPLVKFKETDNEEDVKLSVIRTILATAKSALATTLENPCYTGYYVADQVIATDSFKIASVQTPIFKEPKLISSEMMDLFSVMRTEDIHVRTNGRQIVFSSPDCVIYGTTMEGIEDYAIVPITELVRSEFPSVCKISKQYLLQLLDRLSLFVSPYDKNGIGITFTTDGLSISSKAQTGSEIIPYIESRSYAPFSCSVDISMFISQIKSIVGDVIEFHYGLDTAIKLVDGNCIQIISLLEDDSYTDADDDME